MSQPLDGLTLPTRSPRDAEVAFGELSTWFPSPACYSRNTQLDLNTTWPHDSIAGDKGATGYTRSWSATSLKALADFSDEMTFGSCDRPRPSGAQRRLYREARNRRSVRIALMGSGARAPLAQACSASSSGSTGIGPLELRAWRPRQGPRDRPRYRGQARRYRAAE